MAILSSMSIHFGVDYYPEHWPEERWETDARLMRDMGIQVVRMAEFSWHKLEPRDGVFDFAWLDRAVSLMERYGIAVVLGTPTAAPPAWLVKAHPDILPVDREGRVRGFGGRHHDCQSNRTYRGYASRIADKLSSHYGNSKAVIGWQIDNELGNSHGGLCFCLSCEKAFQRWLEKKYKTAEELNRAWGNAFWSQEVNSFSEVSAPRLTASGENPSALLDWKLFHSDLIVDFLSQQAEIIRRNAPGKFITHNLMGFSDVVSYYDLADKLDFVTHDNYPMLFDGKAPVTPEHELAAQLDFIRSVKKRPFWIMEEQAGITGWKEMSRCPAPGQLALWSVQAIAHGADAVVFFRWRASCIGTEQYWHGILPHSGKPGRRYEELKAMAGKLMPLMDLIEGTMPVSDVALLYSYREKYAMDLQGQSEGLPYLEEVLRYFKPLHERNISIDFVKEGDDLGSYKLVIAPLLYITDKALEDKLMEYVADGGHLVLTMRTGVKDSANLCRQEELPGRLSRTAGVRVVDYDPLGKASVKVVCKGKEYSAGKWADILEGPAEPLAIYSENFYKGFPAVTRNGNCWYIGTEPDEALMDVLLQDILNEAGIEGNRTGYELIRRGPFLFALNHKAEEVPLPDGYEIMTASGEGRMLGPYGWAVLR